MGRPARPEFNPPGEPVNNATCVFPSPIRSSITLAGVPQAECQGENSPVLLSIRRRRAGGIPRLAGIAATSSRSCDGALSGTGKPFPRAIVRNAPAAGRYAVRPYTPVSRPAVRVFWPQHGRAGGLRACAQTARAGSQPAGAPVRVRAACAAHPRASAAHPQAG